MHVSSKIASKSSWNDAQSRGHKIPLRHLVSLAKRYIKTEEINIALICVNYHKTPCSIVFPDICMC